MSPCINYKHTRLLLVPALYCINAHSTPFFRFYATLHTLFQRLSCLPCVSYSALASSKCALAFQSLSYLPSVSYSFLVSAMGSCKDDGQRAYISVYNYNTTILYAFCILMAAPQEGQFEYWMRR